MTAASRKLWTRVSEQSRQNRKARTLHGQDSRSRIGGTGELGEESQRRESG
jgi:hypothetical protein